MRLKSITLEHDPKCGLGKNYRITRATNSVGITLMNGTNATQTYAVGDWLTAHQVSLACALGDWEVIITLAKN